MIRLHRPGLCLLLATVGCNAATVESPGDSGIQAGEWLEQGTGDECNVEALLPPHVYTRRVKNLLTGLAPTAEEVSQVTQDPERLKDLVREWIETPEYREKLRAFLISNLQQRQTGEWGFVPQLGDTPDACCFDMLPEMWENTSSSFVRTALDIIDEERPFNEIASTRTWMMTTALMSWLIYADRYDYARMRFYHEPFTDPDSGITFDASTPASVQIEQQTLYAVEPILNCEDPHTARGGNYRYKLQNFEVTLTPAGRIYTFNTMCGGEIQIDLFTEADYADWRPVTIETLPIGTEPPVPFYDALTLRDARTVQLEIPRAGFFSAPAFLSQWATNVDNSFRVTTNQMLIAGLGLAFEEQDATTPLGDEGLSDEHAAPGTDCYGCHKNLDPMRNYFSNFFKPTTYAPLPADERAEVTPSFSFQGHAREGSDMAALGQTLADHPHFATGWVQKQCLFANAKPCNENDPEFLRVVDAFEDSNLNFKVLLTELYSSPLVTGAGCMAGDEAEFATLSISRTEHLCATIKERMGQDVPCGTSSGTANAMRAALPSEAWPRGATRPDQPTEPSLFYAAAEGSLCKEVAYRLVNAQGSPLQSGDMLGSLTFLVEQFMGVTTADPRHLDLLTVVTNHAAAAEAVGASEVEQLRSAFTLACTSPLITSMDL